MTSTYTSFKSGPHADCGGTIRQSFRFTSDKDFQHCDKCRAFMFSDQRGVYHADFPTGHNLTLNDGAWTDSGQGLYLPGRSPEQQTNFY